MKQKPEAEQADFLRGLLFACVRGIVEDEAAARVEMDVLPRRIVFSIFVATSDAGLLLGNAGATIDAVRRVVWTACKKTRFKADIDVITSGR